MSTVHPKLSNLTDLLPLFSVLNGPGGDCQEPWTGLDNKSISILPRIAKHISISPCVSPFPTHFPRGKAGVAEVLGSLGCQWVK